MKTRVNLYTEEFRPRLLLLTFNFAVALILAAALLLVFLGVGVFQNKSHWEQQVAALERQNENKRQTVDALTTALRERQQDPSKIRELEALRATEQAKRQIVNELSSREIQKQRTFSDLMVSLAEHHHPSLWLTLIRMDTQKLHIEGTSIGSDSVPQWVNKLNDAAYFNGIEFASARLYREDETTLSFVLSSELAGADTSSDVAEGGQ